MKEVFNTLLLFFSLISFGQDNNEQEQLFFEVYNYVPKNYHTTLDDSFKQRFKTWDLSSIATLRTLYVNQEQWSFTSLQIEQLEKEINQLAVALYLEGKPVLIKKVGGYEGCPDEMVYSEKINGTKATIINFCFTCSGGEEYESKFIDIVNYRTRKLLKTE